MTNTEIGDATGATAGAISVLLNSAREAGWQVPDVPRWPTRPHIEEYERLIRLRQEGLTNAEIGERVGVSRAAVVARLRRAVLAGLDVPSRYVPPDAWEGRPAWARVLLRDPCAYCGGPADQIDHIEPVARGGHDDESNWAPACARCNNAKHARPLLSWLLTPQPVALLPVAHRMDR